jgi:predicted kinase
MPASGKTTYYHKFFEDFAHVNLDTLRTRHQEQIELGRLVKQGLNYVVDNTNPRKSDRARYIPQAKDAGYQVDGFFFQSDVAECVKRNEKREGKAKIRPNAIGLISSWLEMPSLGEGFDNLYVVMIQGNDFVTADWGQL